MRAPSRGTVPATLPSDIYPVLRASTGYYLRSFDLLSQLQDDVVQGLIFVTLVHAQSAVPRHRPVSIRELARRLGAPYETVRRHAVELVRSGQCIEQEGRIAIPSAVLHSRRIATFLRRIHANAIRMLIDLTRIGVAKYGCKPPRPPRSGRLGKKELIIARAGTATLLAGLKAVRAHWKGDVIKGLIYTAIWMANVKHITNTRTAASRDVLHDDHRLPVSVMAISRSMHLPYETVRRHAQALVARGICARVGNRGLVVPAASHRRLVGGALVAYRLPMDFLADLRRAGVKV